MGHYSVFYLDALGRTRSSDFLPFENNQAAIDFARLGILLSPIVEVWSGTDLIARLCQTVPGFGEENDGGKIARARAALRATGSKSLEEPDDEDDEAPRRPPNIVRH